MGQNADFMPIYGWDHLELYVGNAKQAAFYYEHACGFTPMAYAGPETGVRDRASYGLEQGDIRFVLTSGLRGDSEITRFTCAYGDGVKDTALTVPDAAEAYRQAVQRGARGVVEPHWVDDDWATRDRRGAEDDRPRRRQRRARQDELLGRVLRADDGLHQHHPLWRRADPHGVLGADVEGDGGRRREDQVPDQRAGRGQAQEPDRRIPRVFRRAGGAARCAAERRHRRDG